MNDHFRIFKTVTVIIILILGSIGNILVVIVVSRRRKMRTVTNYFILNLAIADLTVLISNIPIDLTGEFLDRWIFGKEGCKIIVPFQTMGTIASILTLVVISLSRYHAIVYPFHRQMKIRHARGILVLLWVVSLASITPYALACKYDEITQECNEDFDSIGMPPQTYTLTMFVLQYVIPIIGMTYAYNRIGAELNNQQSIEPGTLMDSEYTRESRKVVKMLSIVVAVFAVLDLPVHVVWIWHDFFDGVKAELFDELHGLAIIMLYGNSFTNPIIYSVCNDQFRSGFKEVFGSCLQPCCVMMNFARSTKIEEQSDLVGRQSKNRSSLNNNLSEANGIKTRKPKGMIERSSRTNFNKNGQTVTLNPTCEIINFESAV